MPIPQLDRVRDLMADHAWRTAGEILDAIGVAGDEAAAITARLRDLRKAAHGSYVVEHRMGRRNGQGVHEYRVGAKNAGTPERRRHRPQPYLRPGVQQFAVALEAHLQDRERLGSPRIGDQVGAKTEGATDDRIALAHCIRDLARTWPA